MRAVLNSFCHRKDVVSDVFLAATFAAALTAAPVLARAQTSTESSTASSGTAMTSHESEAGMKAETVDQRIASLHEKLKITPAEEADWNAVAQTMRDNAEAMDKLATTKDLQSGKQMTAVEDLQTYSQFAQAHVDHLKKLTSVFETLYNSMPEQQKKLADEVFASSRRESETAQHAG